MGYTIIRYRLLNVDVVLRRAVTYGLLTLALILVLGLVTTFVSSVLGVTVNTENAARSPACTASCISRFIISLLIVYPLFLFSRLLRQIFYIS